MSTKKHLIEVRSNSSFMVNYDDMKLVPQVELIVLTHEPKYELFKKGNDEFIKRGHGLHEFRFTASLAGLNTVIGELQKTAASLQVFEQMGNGLNSVIEQCAKTTPKP